jgi:hypothetical protein
MKLPLLMALAVLVASPALQAEPRIFTNSEGHKVKAELVAVEAEQAVLRLANRKIARVPIDSLCADDRSFIRSWWEKNKDKLDPMDFVLKIERKVDAVERDTTTRAQGGRGGGRGGRGRNNNRNLNLETRRVAIDDFQYVCELRNYSPRDVSDIEVEYTIYKRISRSGRDKGGTDTEEIEGSTSIPLLKGTGSATFETEIVTCKDDSTRRGGRRDSHRESIRGVVFTLSKGGREFLTQSDPESLLDRLEEEEKR